MFTLVSKYCHAMYLELEDQTLIMLSVQIGRYVAEGTGEDSHIPSRSL